MDLYLPADYLSLRQELPDWRDAEPDYDAIALPPPEEPVDPSWKVI